ncbi:MAG: lipoyl(octanoyl) transferase LipB [Chitinophagaceae bacterium]|nr:lipoyl(octanoyl) transferase LipB [Chitinophagaceae bacterium]
MQQVRFQDLGNRDYQEIWEYQEKLLKENVEIKAAASWKQERGPFPELAHAAVETVHHLLLVEHPPVYTLGKSGKEENLLLNKEQLQQKGFGYYRINRGGDITFHGPGQIVGYPVLDLEKFYTDLGRYLRSLEEVIILTMADYGLKGERSPGETGVWMDATIKGRERKICAMGIRCSRWITMHGFAFNVNTNLDYFSYIIPCGIQDKQVTSLEKELGRKVDLEDVKNKLKKHFEHVFQVQLV